jgi:eukaryotic-like serine/threonine-protein kinase
MTSPSLHDIDVGVKEGDVLAGKFRVDRILGVGGMGIVVAAHHLQLDEKVALKFLLPDALKVPEAVGRFDREARAAVKIKSDHVARVTDVGKLENGSPYMVMEYLEGGDLSGMLEKTGRLPIDQAVDFVLQACEAIAEAHSLGIVHRDLKPANLFCIRRPNGQLSIKVLDFGISKMSNAAENVSMTRTSAVMGSPVYMSPEQMQTTKGVDARTDIWAIGIILHELLAGRVPFDSQTVTELAIRVAMEAPPPVTSFRPEVPAGLEQAILKCLEKQREQRFQNVAELAAAIAPFGTRHAKGSLERIQGTLQIARPPTDPPPGPGVSPVASTQGVWNTTGSGTRGKSKALVGAAVVVGVAALAVGAFLGLRKGPTPVAPASTASAAASISAMPSASVAPPAASSAVALAPEAQASVSASATAAASQPAPSPGPTSHPVAPQHAGAPPTPGTPAAAPGKAHCDPPYYFDAQGNRVFKKECL